MKVFVSYNHRDQQWAEWISWELEESGHQVTMQAWDFRPGSNFVLEMHRASAEADRILLVLSEDFLGSSFTAAEWAAAFSKDPTGDKRLLLPVRVRPCDPPGILGPVVYLDLIGLSSEEAATALNLAVEGRRVKPSSRPGFPVEWHDPGSPILSLQDDLSLVGDEAWYYSQLPPNSPALAQLLAVPSDPQVMRDSWQTHATGPLTIDLGVDRQGGRVSVDLAHDGPCGFIVGSSGTGTSELLRVVCASLAVRYSPNRIRIHLLDRKGGGVWRSVQDFPHVDGVFTDWDEEKLASRFARSMTQLIEDKHSRLKSTRCVDLGEYNLVAGIDRLPIDVVLVDEFFGDDLLAETLTQIQRLGRSLGIAVIAAASSIHHLPKHFAALARFGVFMGRYDMDELPSLPAFSLLSFDTAFHLQRPVTGRALLGTSRGVIPFQAGWTGGWSPGADDSLYMRSRALEQITTLLRMAAGGQTSQQQ